MRAYVERYEARTGVILNRYGPFEPDSLEVGRALADAQERARDHNSEWPDSWQMTRVVCRREP